MTAHGTTPSAHYLRSRMSRVCVAITGATAQEMIDKAESVVRENPFIEFRLDYLPDPLAAIPKFQEFLYERSEITAIATCRRVAGGGRFRGTPTDAFEILTSAAKAGFHLLDLEIETAEAVKHQQVEAVRSIGAGLILSSHDFDGTRDLDRTFHRLAVFDPDFYKIVSTAKSLYDNVVMKKFLEHISDSANVIGICMGEQGFISRIIGVRAGSVFTFAAATEGQETAAGQVTARTLLETYRIEHIDASTKIYGVAGNPIRHSLSPAMLNSAFRRETINGVFLALDTRKLSDLLKLVHETPIQGLAVTMPFKQEIMPFLAKTDAVSEKIGACNTVVRAQDGRLFGFNTDVGGIVRPLERRLQLRGAKVLVLGAGGAARAAVFGLVEKGADVTILNRTPETAQKLARQAKAHSIRRDQVAKTHFDVIVNATPAGMAGQKLEMILHPEELNARLVFDTVYNPIDTPLIRTARERGIAVITGVEMFVQQGARQFEIWTGKPAPEEEMLRVVLHALRRRAELANPDLPGPRIVPPRPRSDESAKSAEQSISGAGANTAVHIKGSPKLEIHSGARAAGELRPSPSASLKPTAVPPLPQVAAISHPAPAKAAPSARTVLTAPLKPAIKPSSRREPSANLHSASAHPASSQKPGAVPKTAPVRKPAPAAASARSRPVAKTATKPAAKAALVKAPGKVASPRKAAAPAIGSRSVKPSITVKPAHKANGNGRSHGTAPGKLKTSARPIARAIPSKLLKGVIPQTAKPRKGAAKR